MTDSGRVGAASLACFGVSDCAEFTNIKCILVKRPVFLTFMFFWDYFLPIQPQSQNFTLAWFDDPDTRISRPTSRLVRKPRHSVIMNRGSLGRRAIRLLGVSNMRWVYSTKLDEMVYSVQTSMEFVAVLSHQLSEEVSL